MHVMFEPVCIMLETVHIMLKTMHTMLEPEHSVHMSVRAEPHNHDPSCITMTPPICQCVQSNTPLLYGCVQVYSTGPTPNHGPNPHNRAIHFRVQQCEPCLSQQCEPTQHSMNE